MPLGKSSMVIFLPSPIEHSPCRNMALKTGAPSLKKPGYNNMQALIQKTQRV